MYQDRLANGINIIMVRIKNRFTFFSSQICLNSRKRWKVVATSPGETLKVIHCMLLVRFRCLGAWKEYLSEIVAGNAIVCAHEKFCYFYLNIRRRFHRERGTWNFKLERVRLRLTT